MANFLSKKSRELFASWFISRKLDPKPWLHRVGAKNFSELTLESAKKLKDLIKKEVPNA